MQFMLAGALAVAAAASAAHAQNPITFSVEPISLTGFPLSYVAGVNDAGQVACGTIDPLSGGDASRWIAGIATPLPAPAGLTPDRIEAIGITSSGDVAGNVLLGYQHHAVRWVGNVGIVLSVPGFTWAQAWASGSSGTIVGAVAGPAMWTQACLWTSGNTSQLLPSPAGATNALATAVRSDGAVAGIFTDGVAWGVCQWTAQGQVLIALPPTFPIAPHPTLLAADGTIYGNLNQSGSTAPFVLAGGLLGTLPTFGPQGLGSVHGANSLGWMVGSVSDSVAVDWRATLWIGQVPIDLNSVLVDDNGWALDAALGVSENGHICGIGTYQGMPTAFLLRPQLSSYCTASTSSGGCVATMSATGNPSASASSGFVLDVTGVPGQRSGLVFYGVTGRVEIPWGTGTGYLCVKAPTQRTPVATSGGTLGSCDGSLSLDWNAFMSTQPGALGHPRVAGLRVQGQAWYRDPPSPKSTVLSDAIEFVLTP
jgi:hypothetical protein